MSLGSYAVVGAASAALVAVTSSTSSPSALPLELNKLVSRLASRFHSLEAAELQQLGAALCVLVMLRTVYRRLTAPPAFRAEAVGEARTAPASEKETIAALPGVVEGLRASFRSEKTLAYGWRIQQLRGLQKMLAENGDEIFAACKADCGKSQAEWFFESKSIAGDLDIAISQLSEWMKPTCRQTPFWMQPAQSYVTHEPLGTVLIVSPWNYPIALALQPLIGCFAAGNVAVLKPSEHAPAQSAVLAKLLPRYVSAGALAVVEGGVDVAKALLAQSYDFVFYTGGPVVGSIVAQTCSKSLTPFCLELGGKSPTLVDASVDLSCACNRIVQGKFANAGQTCIAPDYVLVHSAVKERFIECMKATIVAQFGADASASENYGRVINDMHWKRVTGYLEKGCTVLYGGESDAKTRYVAPTLVDISSDDLAAKAPIMMEEIFGPLLPIVTVSDMDEAIAFVNAREKPLALYVFTANGATAQRVLKTTTSGSACVNDTVFQYLNSHLPFGGVGNSGVGAYHGRASFDEFSHAKSVLEHATWLDMLPPYNLRYAPHPAKPWVRTMFDLLMDI